MFHQKDPKKYEESIVEKVADLGTSYTSKTDGEITHKQLALETVAYGGEKYIANLLAKKVDAEINKASDEEKAKIQAEIDNAQGLVNNIKIELSGMITRKGKPELKKDEVAEDDGVF